MKRSAKLAAFVVAVAICMPAFGIDITETFDTDPATRGWSGVDNTTAPQNYGFSAGDVTGNAVNPPSGTATAGGEMGGTIQRDAAPPNFYGVDLGGSLDPNTDTFSVSGVIHAQQPNGGGSFLFGYGQGLASYGNAGDNSKNFIGLHFDDGFNTGTVLYRGTGDRHLDQGAPDLPTGRTVPFSLSFDPAANGGDGALTVDIDGTSFSKNLDGDYEHVGPLTHLQVMPVAADSAASIFWIDDLTFTAVSRVVIPEPSTVMLVICGALGLAVRRRRF